MPEYTFALDHSAGGSYTAASPTVSGGTASGYPSSIIVSSGSVILQSFVANASGPGVFVIYYDTVTGASAVDYRSLAPAPTTPIGPGPGTLPCAGPPRQQ